MSNVTVEIIHAVNVMLANEQEPAQVVFNVCELLSIEVEIVAEEVEQAMRKIFTELAASPFSVAEDFIGAQEQLKQYTSILLYCAEQPSSCL